MNSTFFWLVGVVLLLAIVFFYRRSRSHEIGEMEHRDAARFAGLLIAQIKLSEWYKLERGIKLSNIYGSLKDEIDEARIAFRDRVPSAELEHHFDDQLVELLASGDVLRMGAEYCHLFTRS